MICLFCSSPEACFVELCAWNANDERARTLLLQGLCAYHAGEMSDHPHDKTASELSPRFGKEHMTKLVRLHAQAFPQGQPPIYFAQRYFALDSVQGGMVRAARDKTIDTKTAHVHAPTIAIERVPDKAALAEALRDAAKKGG